MEPETPLLDPNEIKQQINPKVTPITEVEILEHILKKGVDQDLLQKLTTVGVDQDILNGFKEQPLEVRLEILELLVQRLLTRVKRLELENEYRFLEGIQTTIKLEKVLKMEQMLKQVYDHFFESGTQENA